MRTYLKQSHRSLQYDVNNLGTKSLSTCCTNLWWIPSNSSNTSSNKITVVKDRDNSSGGVNVNGNCNDNDNDYGSGNDDNSIKDHVGDNNSINGEGNANDVSNNHKVMLFKILRRKMLLFIACSFTSDCVRPQDRAVRDHSSTGRECQTST